MRTRLPHPATAPQLRRADQRHRLPRRRGLTLLDVVIVAICILVLLAVFVPRVQQTRVPARRTQCLNNLKNLSLGTLNYATVYDGSLPPLEDDQYGWPIHILPSLDHSALARQIREQGDPAAMSHVSLPLFACPDDADSHRRPAGLSYAANAGYGDFRADPRTRTITEEGLHSPTTDRDGDGEVTIEDVHVNLATGVYWRTASLDQYSATGWTLDTIEAADGMASTLLLAENANAGPWYSRSTTELSFVIGREALRFATGPGAAGPLELDPPIELGMYAPSGTAPHAPGQSPVPSSQHNGDFNVSFCDGHARALSDQIDPAIYARLMTPAGERYGQSVVNPADY